MEDDTRKGTGGELLSTTLGSLDIIKCGGDE